MASKLTEAEAAEGNVRVYENTKRRLKEMESVITKQTRSVLTKLTQSAGMVAYGYEITDDDDPDDLILRDRIVMIDRGCYEEMGRPDTISITIEPGDSLND